MRKLYPALLLLLSCPASASIEIADLKKLWSVWNTGYTDYFYSVDESQIAYAQSCCNYFDKRLIGFVESRVLTNDAPAKWFRRTFIGAPQLEHFYTTDTQQYLYVLNFGYVDEGVEGVLRSTQEAGAVPLYRAGRFWPETSDLVHWYGTDENALNELVQHWGYVYERIEGYMWPVPPVNVDLQTGGPTTTGAYLAAGTGALVIRQHGVREPNSPSGVGTCGGTADLIIDGGAPQRINGFNYGILPGTFNVYDCYFQMGTPPPGTHLYRVEFSGYAARLVGTYQLGGSYDYTLRFAPNTTQGYLTR